MNLVFPLPTATPLPHALLPLLSSLGRRGRNRHESKGGSGKVGNWEINKKKGRFPRQKTNVSKDSPFPPFPTSIIPVLVQGLDRLVPDGDDAGEVLADLDPLRVAALLVSLQ